MFHRWLKLRAVLRPTVFAAIAMLAWSHHAGADITVSRLLVDMLPDTEVEDLVVTNIGEDQAFVLVEMNEYLHPGTPEEELVAHDSPREYGLLASPNRMVLQPGERAILRLAVLDRPLDADRVYKLTVRPVIGEIESATNAIKLVFAYGVVVIVRPPALHPDLVVERDGRILTATNRGNTMVQLGYGKQCDAAGASCVDIPTKRVYPGSTWATELEFDTPVTFQVRTADVSEKITY